MGWNTVHFSLFNVFVGVIQYTWYFALGDMLDMITLKKKQNMQDIQSMLPYVYIASHCKLFSLKLSALQYFRHCPVSSRLLVLVYVWV